MAEHSRFLVFPQDAQGMSLWIIITEGTAADCTQAGRLRSRVHAD